MSVGARWIWDMLDKTARIFAVIALVAVSVGGGVLLHQPATVIGGVFGVLVVIAFAEGAYRVHIEASPHSAVDAPTRATKFTAEHLRELADRGEQLLHELPSDATAGMQRGHRLNEWHIEVEQVLNRAPTHLHAMLGTRIDSRQSYDYPLETIGWHVQFVARSLRAFADVAEALKKKRSTGERATRALLLNRLLDLAYEPQRFKTPVRADKSWLHEVDAWDEKVEWLAEHALPDAQASKLRSAVIDGASIQGVSADRTERVWGRADALGELAKGLVQCEWAPKPGFLAEQITP